MGQSWKPTQPSAKVVQQHYVNARSHEINTQCTDKYKAATIKAFEKNLAGRLQRISPAKHAAYYEDAYNFLTRTLQSRHLTINFKAPSWFTTENRFESYAQMYERAVQKDGRMVLDDSDKLNPAEIRAAADDRVTFPKQWEAPAAPAQRGLRPGTQAPQHILSRMMAGKKIMPIGAPDTLKGVLNPSTKADGSQGYESPNLRFDPKTKQVFAALNYGRRPHGSSIQYGLSYFILNPKFKVDALYYPGDTFFIPGADAQVSYQTLGGIYGKAKTQIGQEIIRSCFDGIQLDDTADPGLLMEAHIFQEVRFAGGISELILEPTADTTIIENARKFCLTWGIKFSRQVSGVRLAI